MQKVRILVVEDEHKIANAVKKGLEQELFAVDMAFSGENGLDLATTEDYDLIILDLMLPGLGGMEIIKELRDKQIHTPVIILTARDQVEDKVKGLNLGADDYLTKPFAFDELLARVRALTRRPRTAISAILSVGDLSIDTSTFEVKRKNKIIEVSKTEYSLLEYLMRHPGKIVTKEQIINHVWNYDADVLPNTVEVYIGYLRKKIDLPFRKEKALIHTVRGFGYKIH